MERLSAHLDQDELLELADGFTLKVKMAFLFHGLKQASEALQKIISEELGKKFIDLTYL